MMERRSFLKIIGWLPFTGDLFQINRNKANATEVKEKSDDSIYGNDLAILHYYGRKDSTVVREGDIVDIKDVGMPDYIIPLGGRTIEILLDTGDGCFLHTFPKTFFRVTVYSAEYPKWYSHRVKRIKFMRYD